MGIGKEVVFFIAVGSITTVCLAVSNTNMKFFELQSAQCIVGAVEDKENVQGRIQCLDICLHISRLSTDLTTCTAAQYFAQTNAYQLYVYRGQRLPIVCGPMFPAIFASPLMGPFVIYPGPATWSQAKTACASSGGMLACITSQVQNELVGALLESNGLTGSYAWLGASKPTGGSFTWVSQQTFFFTSYAPTEPSGGETENCLVSRYAPPTLEWWDRQCDIAYAFICKY